MKIIKQKSKGKSAKSIFDNMIEIKDEKLKNVFFQTRKKSNVDKKERKLYFL